MSFSSNPYLLKRDKASSYNDDLNTFLKLVDNLVVVKSADAKAAADIRQKLENEIKTQYGGSIYFQPGGSVLKRIKTPDSDIDLYVVLGSCGPISPRDSTRLASDVSLSMDEKPIQRSTVILQQLHDVVRSVVSNWMPAQGKTTRVRLGKSSVQVLGLQGVDFDLLPSYLDKSCMDYLVPDRKNTGKWRSSLREQDAKTVKDLRTQDPDYAMNYRALKYLRQRFDWSLGSFALQELMHNCYHDNIKFFKCFRLEKFQAVVNYLFNCVVKDIKISDPYFGEDVLYSYTGNVSKRESLLFDLDILLKSPASLTRLIESELLE